MAWAPRHQRPAVLAARKLHCCAGKQRGRVEPQALMLLRLAAHPHNALMRLDFTRMCLVLLPSVPEVEMQSAVKSLKSS